MTDIPGNPDGEAPFGREQMVTTEFPGNSYSESSKKSEKKPSKKPETVAEVVEQKKNNKVVQGKVIRKKKGLGSRVKETFTGDDARSVGSYILFDVIIPAAKNMLADAASQGTERLLFGDVRSKSRSSSRGSSYTSYGSMYRRSDNRDRDRDGRRELSNRARARHDFDDIIIESRSEAEDVLEQLSILIDDYDQAKVSDMYDLLGITANPTDDRWGWVNLRDGRVVRVRQGYLLDLPAPVPLD